MPAKRKVRKSPSILVLALLVACATQVAAQATPEPAEPIESDPRYSKLVADAVEAFDAGNFEDSREMLRQAHALRPNARTLRGMGLASFEMGNYPWAVVDLEAALAETRQPMSVEQRTEVEKLLTEADALIARYAIRGLPADGKLTVDEGDAVWDSTGLLLLGQGSHRVTVASGVDLVRNYRVQARGGERAELEVAPPSAASTPHAPEPPVLTAPLPLAFDAPVRKSPPTGVPNFVAYAALGGAAITAGLAIWQWRERESEVDAWNSRECLRSRRTRLANCSEHQDAYETAETWAWIAAGTTLALTAGAVTLLVLNRRTEEKPETASAPVCLPGPGAFACRVSF